MKSFNQHLDKKSENLQEDPFDDLTDLLWVGAAGAGLWGLSKGWDRFGKDAVASLPFAPKSWKAASVDRKKERADKKAADAAKIAGPSDTEKAQAKIDKSDAGKKDADTKADAAALDYDKDSKGRIKNQPDAQEYKDTTGKAPEGWVTSPGGKGKEAAGYPKKGIVLSVSDARAFDDKRKQDVGKKLGARKAGKAAKDDDVGARLGFDKGPKPGEVETGSYMHTAKAELSEFEEKDRNEILENLVLGGSMTITESNELQAIMALDDVGIKAEINRKGQVVIKKKDKKKAHRALEKSFPKGGWPPLKLEDVEIEENNRAQVSKVADEIEALADKGGAEAPALFSIANNLRKGKLPTGLKISKKASAIFKKHGVREEVKKPRTAYEVVSEARTNLTEAVDAHAVRELYLYMESEPKFQRQKESIIKNILRKIKSGKYDHTKAPKLWMYWVDTGAKQYVKDYGGNVKVLYPKEVRQSLAVQLANEYKAEIDIGNYS